MNLRPLIVWVDRSARRRIRLTTHLFLGLLGIGVLDTVSGSNMSFGVF